MRNPLLSKEISGKAQEQQDLRGCIQFLTCGIAEISEKLEHQIVSRQSMENRRNAFLQNARLKQHLLELKVISLHQRFCCPHINKGLFVDN